MSVHEFSVRNAVATLRSFDQLPLVQWPVHHRCFYTVSRSEVPVASPLPFRRGVRRLRSGAVLEGVPLRLGQLAAAAYAALGVVMFVVPGWAADEFAWPVSSFLAMTIGAWCLGTAAFAVQLVRVRHRRDARGVAAYVYLFSLFQALVLLVHARDLELDRALALPYIATIVIGVVAAGAGAAVFARGRTPADETRAPLWLWLLVLAFALVVAVLAAPLVDGYDSPSSIWPGELSNASARSFAAFFGALSLSAAVLAWMRALRPMLAYALAGIVLNLVILFAAIVYIDRFDFGAHPGQFLYVGLYVLVGIVALAIVVFARGVERGRARPRITPSAPG